MMSAITRPPLRERGARCPHPTPEGRPEIPAALKRDVLIEAGHRCASPTCKAASTEIAHIVPWEKVQTHTFENPDPLCPNCPQGSTRASSIAGRCRSTRRTRHHQWPLRRNRAPDSHDLRREPDDQRHQDAAAPDVAMMYLIKEGMFVRGLDPSELRTACANRASPDRLHRQARVLPHHRQGARSRQATRRRSAA
jgi:hypothetical protein